MSDTATATAADTGPNPDTVLFCMQGEDCRTKIADTTKQRGDIVLWYYEHASDYGGMTPIIKKMYKPCLRLLKCHAQCGNVLSVGTDGDAPVQFPGGLQLWPMFVELKDVPCFENLLITGGAGEMTPYLFFNKPTRDKVVAWLSAMLSA